jgi:hypothetical protein
MFHSICPLLIFNDVLFKDKNGKSTQIDHIVIRNNGVFVVETKNYAGRIYGNDEQQKWTQVLAYGDCKNQFYNPVKQNNTHVFQLSKLLSMKDIFVSVIVFPRAELYVESDQLICNGKNELNEIIHSNTNIQLNRDTLNKIYCKINESKIDSDIARVEHIDNIHKMQDKIASNICPRCNIKLVLRQGKSNKFYGCSNYPKCKFTKQIDDQDVAV